MKLAKAEKRDKARYKKYQGMKVRRGGMVAIGNSRAKRDEKIKERRQK